MNHGGSSGRWLPWAILGLALAVRLLVAWPLRQPGYTDAYYYAVGARQLHAGEGFREPFVWNWLGPFTCSDKEGYQRAQVPIRSPNVSV